VPKKCRQIAKKAGLFRSCTDEKRMYQDVTAAASKKKKM
jgi:hypothetical protein